MTSWRWLSFYTQAPPEAGSLGKESAVLSGMGGLRVTTLVMDGRRHKPIFAPLLIRHRQEGRHQQRTLRAPAPAKRIRRYIRAKPAVTNALQSIVGAWVWHASDRCCRGEPHTHSPRPQLAKPGGLNVSYSTSPRLHVAQGIPDNVLRAFLVLI